MFQLAIEKRQKDRLAQLSDIMAAIQASEDIKGLLERTLQKTLRALNSERGSIFLAENDGKELSLGLSYNVEGEYKSVKKKIGEGIAGKVARDRIAVLVKDIRHDARFQVYSNFRNYKTNSFLSVPVSSGSRLIGVINITENLTRRPYSEKDLDFLKIVADCIAIRIEKSQMASEIDRLRKKAESESKFADIGKFSSGISHELSNPLDGVTRYVNLALSATDEGVAKEYLLEARSGIARLTNIVRSLLELSRYKKPQAPKFINVNKSIDSSIDLLRYQVLTKSIDIVRNFSSGLPKIPDYGIESVFSNIFKNSLDAIDEKGRISVSTERQDGFIKISFSDTGSGISQEDMPMLFEPFFTTKPAGKGSGLGLSICYDIVRRYNGSIDVSSELNKGSSFTVQIPITEQKHNG